RDELVKRLIDGIREHPVLSRLPLINRFVASASERVVAARVLGYLKAQEAQPYFRVYSQKDGKVLKDVSLEGLGQLADREGIDQCLGRVGIDEILERKKEKSGSWMSSIAWAMGELAKAEQGRARDVLYLLAIGAAADEDTRRVIDLSLNKYPESVIKQGIREGLSYVRTGDAGDNFSRAVQDQALGLIVKKYHLKAWAKTFVPRLKEMREDRIAKGVGVENIERAIQLYIDGVIKTAEAYLKQNNPSAFDAIAELGSLEGEDKVISRKQRREINYLYALAHFMAYVFSEGRGAADYEPYAEFQKHFAKAQSVYGDARPGITLSNPQESLVNAIVYLTSRRQGKDAFSLGGFTFRVESKKPLVQGKEAVKTDYTLYEKMTGTFPVTITYKGGRFLYSMFAIDDGKALIVSSLGYMCSLDVEDGLQCKPASAEYLKYFPKERKRNQPLQKGRKSIDAKAVRAVFLAGVKRAEARQTNKDKKKILSEKDVIGSLTKLIVPSGVIITPPDEACPEYFLKLRRAAGRQRYDGKKDVLFEMHVNGNGGGPIKTIKAFVKHWSGKKVMYKYTQDGIKEIKIEDQDISLGLSVFKPMRFVVFELPDFETLTSLSDKQWQTLIGDCHEFFAYIEKLTKRRGKFVAGHGGDGQGVYVSKTGRKFTGAEISLERVKRYIKYLDAVSGASSSIQEETAAANAAASSISISNGELGELLRQNAASDKRFEAERNEVALVLGGNDRKRGTEILFKMYGGSRGCSASPLSPEAVYTISTAALLAAGLVMGAISYHFGRKARSGVWQSNDEKDSRGSELVAWGYGISLVLLSWGISNIITPATGYSAAGQTESLYLTCCLAATILVPVLYYFGVKHSFRKYMRYENRQDEEIDEAVQMVNVFYQVLLGAVNNLIGFLGATVLIDRVPYYLWRESEIPAKDWTSALGLRKEWAARFALSYDQYLTVAGSQDLLAAKEKVAAAIKEGGSKLNTEAIKQEADRLFLDIIGSKGYPYTQIIPIDQIIGSDVNLEEIQHLALEDLITLKQVNGDRPYRDDNNRPEGSSSITTSQRQGYGKLTVAAIYAKAERSSSPVSNQDLTREPGAANQQAGLGTTLKANAPPRKFNILKTAAVIGLLAAGVVLWSWCLGWISFPAVVIAKVLSFIPALSYLAVYVQTKLVLVKFLAAALSVILSGAAYLLFSY
ncbi:MAG: hypothetical protein ABH858_06535, partial [Candidatus Omnitrophota bacterium]